MSIAPLPPPGAAARLRSVDTKRQRSILRGMSDTAIDVLERLLEQCDLTDKSEKVADTMYMLRWGSATVIAAASGEAIVVIAPLFETLPSKNPDQFCRRLLELNSKMGGTAGFAIGPDGAVVLQVGRGVKGLDADEFGLMLGTVGKFADDYDDVLRDEFYA